MLGTLFFFGIFAFSIYAGLTDAFFAGFFYANIKSYFKEKENKKIIEKK